MNTVGTTKKTAFVSIIAYNWVIHHQLDCAIAILSEKKRKVETIAVICDGKSEAIQNCCEFVRIGKNSQPGINKDDICNACISSKMTWINSYFNNTILMSELSGETDSCEEEVKIKSCSFKDRDSNIYNNIAVSPSLSDVRTTSILDVVNENKNALNEEAESFSESYSMCLNLIKKIGQTKKLNECHFSIFNGRFHPYSGFFSCLRDHQILPLIHERGLTKGSFRISFGDIPNNAKSQVKQLREHKEATMKEIYDTKQYLLKRITSGAQNFADFVGKRETDVNQTKISI